ncbi:hypothetical protein E8E11_002958 [Didymella keratinophila]|nr:hypothetical protein E8E11_002958 [Didymella keratinophila]
MASVGDSARSEVSLIETLRSALHRLHGFDASPERLGATAANNPVAEDYEGFANWYTGMGASASSRAGSSVRNNANDQEEMMQIYDIGPQPGPLNTDAPAASGISDNTSIDSCPFDFDLLHMDANATFSTSNFSGLGDLDRGLLEDLFWMPR